jgi:hypothetical protein
MGRKIGGNEKWELENHPGGRQERTKTKWEGLN